MDKLFAIIDAICATISILGSVFAVVYYKKTKHIRNLISYKDAANKLAAIIGELVEMKQFTNLEFCKGKNLKFIAKSFIDIEKRVRVIISELDSKTHVFIEETLNFKDCVKYMSQVTEGAKTKNGYLDNENYDFDDFLSKLSSIESFLKSKAEKAEEKLK